MLDQNIDFTDVGSRSQPSFINPNVRAQEHARPSGADRAGCDVEGGSGNNEIVEVHRSQEDVGCVIFESSRSSKLKQTLDR